MGISVKCKAQFLCLCEEPGQVGKQTCTDFITWHPLLCPHFQ